MTIDGRTNIPNIDTAHIFYPYLDLFPLKHLGTLIFSLQMRKQAERLIPWDRD